MPAPASLGEPLRSSRNSIYLVNREYRIVTVNEGYVQFAALNDGGDVVIQGSVGICILSLAPEPLRTALKSCYDRAFSGAPETESEYECPTPTEFRRFRMRLLPFGKDHVLTEHALQYTEALPASDETSVAVLRADFADQNSIVNQCCNCRKVRRMSDGSWVWVRALICEARQAPLPVSHGLCEVCFHTYIESFLEAPIADAPVAPAP